MTDSNHTPGPWRAGQDGNMRVYGPDNSQEHSGLIASVYKGRANARLIAAAPELLEALEAVAAWMPGDWDLAMTPPLNAIARQIRAAIDKAKGE